MAEGERKKAVEKEELKEAGDRQPRPRSCRILIMRRHIDVFDRVAVGVQTAGEDEDPGDGRRIRSPRAWILRLGGQRE